MPTVFHAFGGAVAGAAILGAIGGLYGAGWWGVIVGGVIGAAFGMVG